jgi:hypothetical protein
LWRTVIFTDMRTYLFLLLSACSLLSCQRRESRILYQMPSGDKVEALFDEITSMQEAQYRYRMDSNGGSPVVYDSSYYDYFFTPQHKLARIIHYYQPQRTDTVYDFVYYRYYKLRQRSMYGDKREHDCGTGVIDSAKRTYTFTHLNGWKNVIQYNERWKILSETEYYSSGEESERKLYSYDQEGNLVMISTPLSIGGIELETYRYAGSLTEHKRYQRCSDPKDTARYCDLRLHERYYQNGADSSVVTHRDNDSHIDSVYYRRGRLYYKAEKDTSDGHRREDFYEYDDEGKMTTHRCIETNSDGDESPYFAKTYTYNEIGDLEKEDGIFTGVSDEHYLFEYRYDDHHNWIDKKVFYNGEITYRSKRKIQYAEAQP